jgi:hypothetical protein
VGEGGSGEDESVDAFDRARDSDDELARECARDERLSPARVWASDAAEGPVLQETSEGEVLTFEEREEERECC